MFECDFIRDHICSHDVTITWIHMCCWRAHHDEMHLFLHDHIFINPLVKNRCRMCRNFYVKNVIVFGYCGSDQSLLTYCIFYYYYYVLIFFSLFLTETILDTRTATAELGWTAYPASGVSVCWSVGVIILSFWVLYVSTTIETPKKIWTFWRSSWDKIYFFNLILFF